MGNTINIGNTTGPFFSSKDFKQGGPQPGFPHGFSSGQRQRSKCNSGFYCVCQIALQPGTKQIILKARLYKVPKIRGMFTIIAGYNAQFLEFSSLESSDQVAWDNTTNFLDTTTDTTNSDHVLRTKLSCMIVFQLQTGQLNFLPYLDPISDLYYFDDYTSGACYLNIIVTDLLNNIERYNTKIPLQQLPTPTGTYTGLNGYILDIPQIPDIPLSQPFPVIGPDERLISINGNSQPWINIGVELLDNNQQSILTRNQLAANLINDFPTGSTAHGSTVPLFKNIKSNNIYYITQTSYTLGPKL